MLKKAMTTALATGVLLTSGGGVLAAEKNPGQESAKTAAATAAVQTTSTAYTSVDVVGSTVQFGVQGLQSPFNTKYYQRVAWTSDPALPNTFNTLAVAVASPSGTSYSAYKSESLSSIRSKVASGQRIYGWARAANGLWYEAGSAVINY